MISVASVEHLLRKRSDFQGRGNRDGMNKGVDWSDDHDDSK